MRPGKWWPKAKNAVTMRAIVSALTCRGELRTKTAGIASSGVDTINNWSSQELMIHGREAFEGDALESEGCFKGSSGTTDIKRRPRRLFRRQLVVDVFLRRSFLDGQQVFHFHGIAVPAAQEVDSIVVALLLRNV